MAGRRKTSSGVGGTTTTGGGGGGEFKGFAAFASSSPPSSLSSATDAAAGGGASSSPLRPTPLYVGSDPTLSNLFRRIGQKRDGLTKTKALIDLTSYAFPSENDDDAEGVAPVDLPRSERILALRHLIYLHSTILHYDESSAVRAASLRCLTSARRRVPKAWKTLILCDGGKVLGMGWCSTSDPSSEEVREAAGRFAESARESFSTDGEEEGGKAMRTSVAKYALTMLNFGRASALHDELFGSRLLSDSSSDGKNKKGGAGGKGKKKKGNASDGGDDNEAGGRNDEAEERFERTVLSVLGGLERLVREHPERPSSSSDDDGSMAKSTSLRYSDVAEDEGALWRHLGSSRSQFRRRTYGLATSVCRYAPSLVLRDDGDGDNEERSEPSKKKDGKKKGNLKATKGKSKRKKLRDLLPLSLASEKDPSNVPHLLEATLSHVALFASSSSSSSSTAAWDVDRGGMDVEVVAANLTKMFRKACRGARGEDWCPVVLPLVASLPRGETDDDEDDEEKMGRANAILNGLWEGRNAAPTKSDELSIVSSVAECSSFLLLRRRRRRKEKKDDGTTTAKEKEEEEEKVDDRVNDSPPSDGGEHDDDNGGGDGGGQSGTERCSEFFLDALSYVLSSSSVNNVPPTAKAARNSLVATIGRCLVDLDRRSSPPPSAAVAAAADDDEERGGGDAEEEEEDDEARTTCALRDVESTFWDGVDGAFSDAVAPRPVPPDADDADADEGSIEALNRLVAFLVVEERRRQRRPRPAAPPQSDRRIRGPLDRSLRNALRTVLDRSRRERAAAAAAAPPTASEARLVRSSVRRLGPAFALAPHDDDGDTATAAAAEEAVEEFCGSTLPSWIRRSSPSPSLDGDDDGGGGGGRTAIEIHFSTLRDCLLLAYDDGTSRSKTWESFLRRIAASDDKVDDDEEREADYEVLAVGLEIMTGRRRQAADDQDGEDEAPTTAVAVACPTLNELARRAGEEVDLAYRRRRRRRLGGDGEKRRRDEGEEDEEDDEEKLDGDDGGKVDGAAAFLRVCAGFPASWDGFRDNLDGDDGVGGAAPLVDEGVVRRWVDAACRRRRRRDDDPISDDDDDDDDVADPLLETLLRMVSRSMIVRASSSSSPPVVDGDLAERSVLEAWRRGGRRAWDGFATDVLRGGGAGGRRRRRRAADEADDDADDAARRRRRRRTREELADRVASTASDELKRSLLLLLGATSSSSPRGGRGRSSATEIRRSSRVWSRRALRVLRLVDDEGGDGTVESSSPASSPLERIGLSDVDLWRRSSRPSSTEGSPTSAEFLFACLVWTLDGLPSTADRVRAMTTSSSSNGDEFAAYVLTSVSAGAAERLLASLGRKGFREEEDDDDDEEGAASDDVLEGWFAECVRILSERTKSPEAQEDEGGGGRRRVATKKEGLAGCVSALSVLADAAFPESGAVDPPAAAVAAVEKEEGAVDDGDDDIVPEDVKVGDALWYVPRPTRDDDDGDGRIEGEDRVRVEVVKVHDDDYPNLYFTIRSLPAEGDDDDTGADGATKTTTRPFERQTIPSRLKRKPRRGGGGGDSTTVRVPALPLGEKEEEDDDRRRRKRRWRKLVVDELVLPYLSDPPFDASSSYDDDGGRGGSFAVAETAAECLGMALSQFGLPEEEGGSRRGGGVGVGSDRYELFRAVSNLDRRVGAALVSLDDDGGGGSATDATATMTTATRGLRLLSLCMEDSRLRRLRRRSSSSLSPSRTSSGASTNFEALRFRPDESLNGILRLYADGRRARTTPSLDAAALSWLATSASTLEGKVHSIRVARALDVLSSRVLDRDDAAGGGARATKESSAVPILRTLAGARRLRRGADRDDVDRVDRDERDDDVVDETEKRVLGRLIDSFANAWTGDDGDDVRRRRDPFLSALDDDDDAEEDEGGGDDGGDEEGPEAGGGWRDPFANLLRRVVAEGDVGLLLPGIAARRDDLCRTLFDARKRWIGHRLLDTLLREDWEAWHGKEDGDGDTPATLSEGTRRRLAAWTESLEEEEAEEVAEDARVAAEWLPRPLADLVESWGDGVPGPTRAPSGTADLVGGLLSWLVCLNVVDRAASVDMRNRTSLSSYLDRTGAAKFVLESTSEIADLDVKKKKNFGDGRGDVGSWMDEVASFDRCDFDFDDDGTDPSTSKKKKLVSDLATYALFRTVESLPTLAKKWWSDDCPKSVRPSFVSFVEKRVAPETLRRELDRIRRASVDFGDMSVTGGVVSREVVAAYVQDECKLSVMIKIPTSFPLRNVEVDCQRTLGIPEKRWRRWSLQIMTMLNGQDGSVLDALLLWKRNVDKEFDGVEPCPVCYSVLCVKTHAMPNLECKTCLNRFHANCLYKWFQSSGKNQCVLCQRPWSGTKV